MKMFALVLAVVLCVAPAALADWTIDEGFEGGAIPAGWTVIDSDGDGLHWFALEHVNAHTGDWCAAVECYGSDGDDWLITPQVSVAAGDSLVFYARAWFSTEDFEVRLSAGTTSIDDFDYILDTISGAGATYVRYAYDLTSYAGQDCYLAVRWLQDTYAMIVDDVQIGQGVYETADIGMLSIEVPEAFHVVETAITPSGTVKNFGVSEVTEDFDVTCEIVDELMATVYTSTVVHTGAILPGATDVVAFVDGWQPTELGTYTVTMTTLLAGDEEPANDSLESETEIVEHQGTGGPDAMGYQWIDNWEPDGPVYDWIEISETGTSSVMYGVPTFYGDDNFSEPIPIGFVFPFYGLDRTYCYVDINGEVLLAENTWCDPYPSTGWGNDGNMFNYAHPIPGYEAMPALIAVYWDDLEAIQGVGDVYFQTFGEEPDRYCVIEWHDLKFRYGTVQDTTLTFEIILHEDGDIVFQYQDTAIGQTGSVSPHDNGRSATVAIQSDAADVGLCYLREIVESGQYIGVEPPGNLLDDGLAIRFFIEIDEQPPVFGHEEVGNTFDTTPEMSVAITDVSGVLTDSLYYNWGSGWQAVAHAGFEEPNVYHFELPEIPISTEVEYYFAATDNSEANNRGTLPAGAPVECFSFRVLPTNGVDVLLAYPGGQDWQNLEFPEFTMALDAADVVYDVYSWYEFEDYRFPESYSTIFVYANSASGSAKHDTLSLALMEFLDSGTNGDPKNLFVASDDFATSQYGHPNSKPMTKFFTAYLRGGYVPDGSPHVPPHGGTDGIGGPDTYDYSDGSIIGMGGSPIGHVGVELPVYSNSPDVIVNGDCPDWYWSEVTNPEISSWGSFKFEDGPFSGHAYAYGMGCGIWLDNLIYKSFFISFDLSQFTDDNDTKMLVSDAIDWFGVPTGVPGSEDEIAEARFALSQNRPNPFNPVTTISYAMERAGDVRVTVYDVSGRRVRTLVDGPRASGEHCVVWNGSDDAGAEVGSGIYFYRMESEGFASTRKMILLK